MEKQLIYNSIQTPDGTILVSRHRHDYVTHTDANGLTYFLDGGTSYRRMSHHPEAPHTDLAVYSDAPFEEIRQYLLRGGRGKDGTEPLTWTPLNEMNDEWVQNCIVYNEAMGAGDAFTTKMYQKELDYRKEHAITIEE